ncbi:hypothetical protein BGW37DRAFT_493865 [Umbelopsis sp. PMI_123]|nr:hypothetical protein BGW37DRAFT_493865 [Umbelopsis sp. PMI_123]
MKHKSRLSMMMSMNMLVVVFVLLLLPSMKSPLVALKTKARDSNLLVYFPSMILLVLIPRKPLIVPSLLVSK